MGRYDGRNDEDGDQRGKELEREWLDLDPAPPGGLISHS